jgi:hypothetical protein
VLHDAADVEVGAVVQRVDVDLDGSSGWLGPTMPCPAMRAK